MLEVLRDPAAAEVSWSLVEQRIGGLTRQRQSAGPESLEQKIADKPPRSSPTVGGSAKRRVTYQLSPNPTP